MHKFNWKVKSVAITIFALLVLVWNPELRAFILVLDFLGADLVLLLLGGYINQYRPVIVFHLRPVMGFVAAGASPVWKSLRWIAYGLHPRDEQWAQIDHIGIAGGVATRIAIGRLVG